MVRHNRLLQTIAEFLQHSIARCLHNETIVLHRVPLSWKDMLWFFVRSKGQIITDSFKNNIPRSNVTTVFTYTGDKDSIPCWAKVLRCQHGGKYGVYHRGVAVDLEADRFYGWGTWTPNYLPPPFSVNYNIDRSHGKIVAVLPNGSDHPVEYYENLLQKSRYVAGVPKFGIEIIPPGFGFRDQLDEIKFAIVFDFSTPYYECIAHDIPVIIFDNVKELDTIIRGGVLAWWLSEEVVDYTTYFRKRHCNPQRNWRRIWLRELLKQLGNG